MSMVPESVRVSRQYIQKGLRGDSQRCAIALALGGGPKTDVSSSMIRFNDVCYFTRSCLQTITRALWHRCGA